MNTRYYEPAHLYIQRIGRAERNRAFYSPLLGWKACQQPHNCEYATGVDTPDWFERCMYIAIAVLTLAVTAVSKGWL